MDLLDPHIVVRLLIAFAAFASVVSVAIPYLGSDQLDERMRAVAQERERMRLGQRQRLSVDKKPVGFIGFAKHIAKSLDLIKWLGEENMRKNLMLAGYRSPGAEMVFAFFHLAVPIGMFFFSLIYIFFLLDLDQTVLNKFLIVIVATIVSYKLPNIYLSNQITKRQLLLRRGAPDMVDLLLIAIESGSSIEVAFQRVGQEVGQQCIPLAEEVAVLLAELSYLPDRRLAFENFNKRTQIESIKQLVLVLTQSEKYGTSLAGALRVVAEEGRQNRMAEAEKKAASLPPKLTVPMILFFLPVVFVIIITPAAIQISSFNH